MNEEIRDTILKALFAYRGDDYARVRRAFYDMTPEQMDAPYGRSGETCRQVLARHMAHVDRVDAAAAWVQAQEEAR